MPIRYKDAGVDVQRGYEAVQRMKSAVESTHGPEVLSGIGGFGGLFAPDMQNYRQPVLVSGTDGVGTKLKLAFALDKHDTVGIDCVAMCVNDVICTGAKPLFFLDYIATGLLEPGQVEAVVTGIAAGCRQAGAALVGGETAEMPGFYTRGEYDVAGFCVGMVERDRIIEGDGIRSGDALLGLASSGVHSNGFSLIRRIIPEESWSEDFQGQSLGDVLLQPTRIYVKAVQSLIGEISIGGIAHITGGGFIENIPRVLSAGLTAVIDQNSWPTHAIFMRIQELAELDDEEMYNTFNMGIGMVVILPQEEVARAQAILSEIDEPSYLIGEVRERQPGEEGICFV